jgi:hypothetical protein
MAAGNPPTDCTKLRSYASSLGCCFGNVVAYLSASNQTLGSELTSPFSTCQQSVPAPCSLTSGNLKLSILIALNASYDWSSQYQSDLSTAIQKDIALFLGGSLSLIEVTDVAAASVARSSSTSTYVTVSVQGSADSDTQSYKSALDQASTSISIPYTQELYANTYPHQVVEVSSVDVSQEGAATTAVVSTLLVAMSILLALL